MEKVYTEDDDYEELKAAVVASPEPDEEKPALNSSKADLVAWLNSPSDTEDGADDPDDEEGVSESANPYNPDAGLIVVGDAPVPTRDENTPPYGRYAVEDNDLSGFVGVDDMYKTYSDDRGKPFPADGGVEQELEEKAQYDVVAAPLRAGVKQGHVS